MSHEEAESAERGEDQPARAPRTSPSARDPLLFDSINLSIRR